MNKNTILISSLIAMVVLNVGLLAFMFFRGSHKPPQNRMSKEKAGEIIQKEFGFNDVEMLEFDKSREQHFRSIEDLNQQIQKSSIAYYQMEENQPAKDSLLQVVTELSTSFYRINDEHIQQMRNLCAPDKKEALERFIEARVNNHSRRGPARKERTPRK